MKIGEKEFDLENSAYICGILNVTPDSFSDGGKYNRLDAALFHVEEMMEAGAAIVDVGGESTRPGYTMISNDEEIERVVPVIRAIKDRFDVPVSLDTYKAEVAREGLEAGADLINDIWGLMYEKKHGVNAQKGRSMAEVIASSGVACNLMHNRVKTDYTDFKTDFMNETKEIIRMAKQYGIQEDAIILDPGIGFGKNRAQNLAALDMLDEFCNLGYPVLLGTSRKTFIGLTLDLPKEERLEGTIATNVVGLMKGASLFRVHDVKENYRALKMAAAVIGMEFDK